MAKKIKSLSVSRREFLKTIAVGVGGVALGGTIVGCYGRYTEVGPELIASGGETVLDLTRTSYPGAYDVHTIEMRGAIQVVGIRGYEDGDYQYMVDGEVIGSGEHADTGNTFAVDQYRLRSGRRLQWVRTV